MRRPYKGYNRHVRSRIEDKVFLGTRMAINKRTWYLDLGISEPVILHAYQAIGSGLPGRVGNSVNLTTTWREQTWRPTIYQEDYVRTAPAIDPQRQLKPA